jgi:hypothetical protein
MFELKGIQYSLEELQQAAKDQNLEFEEFMEKMRAKGLVEAGEQQAEVVEEQETEVVEEQETFEDPFLQSAKKIYGPVEEVAVAEPTTTIEQPDTELPSEDTSSELVEAIETPEIKFGTRLTGKQVQERNAAIAAAERKKEQAIQEAIQTPEEFKVEKADDASVEKLLDLTRPFATATDGTKKQYKNFYNRDADQVKADLQQMYPGVDITYLPFQKSSQSGKKNLKLKKGDKEITLWTETPSRDLRTNPELENDKQLKEFLKNVYSKKDISSAVKNIEFAESEALKVLKLNDTEKAEVAEDLKQYDSPDLFKPVTTRKSYINNRGQTNSIVKTVKPYEDRLLNTYSKLKADPTTSDLTEDELKELADRTVREELKQEEIYNYQNERIQDLIADIGNRDIRKQVQGFLNVGYLNANYKSQVTYNRIKVEQKATEIAQRIIAGKNIEEGDSDRFIEYMQLLDIPVDPSLNNPVELPNGTVVSESFIQAIKGFQAAAFADDILYFKSSEEKDKAIGDMSNVDAALNATKRDYDLEDKALTTIGIGTSDIVTGVGVLAGKALSLPAYLLGGYQPMNEALDKFSVKYKNTTNEIRESYVRDVSFDEAFSDPSNFGKFALQEVSNQLPIIASMMASGGAAMYVIGASSTGNQMMDMQTEIASGTKNYSASEVWLKSLGFGIAEGGFAALTTIPILNRAKQTFLKGKPINNSVIDNGVASYAKQNYKGIINDTFLETIGEVATVGSQNLILGNPFIEGMDHAGFSGAAFGLAFSAIPFMRGMHLSRYSDYSKLKRVRDIQSELRGLGIERTNANTEAEQQRIDEQIKKLSIEAANEISRQEKFVNNYITAKSGQYVIDITNRQATIQNEAKAIVADSDLSREQKAARLDQLQVESNELQSAKESALTDAAKMNFETEFLLLKGTDKAKYNEYFDDAATLLNSQNPSKTITDKAIEQKAVDLYFEDQVVEENSKAAKNLGTNFKSFNTVNDAIASIEADNKINDADKTTLIQNLKNGDDGAAVRYEDGRRLTYAVVENQVLNKRKYIRAHEVSHQVFWDIFGTNPDAFVPIAEQLLHTTKEISPALHKKLSQETEAVEVVARFIESVGAGQVDFRKDSDKKAIAGLFGTMLQQNAIDSYDFNFTGETDMFNFVVGVGKKIASGELSMEDIAKAKKGAVAQEVKGRVVQMPRQAEQATLKRQAASARSAGTLDQALNKFSQNEDGSAKFASKEEWRKSSEAGEAYFTVQQTSLLDGEIRKQARLKGLPEDIDISEIKDNIALRVFENYDPSKNNLFGYLLGKVNIVEKAVLDSAKKFGTRVESTAASIDTAAGETGAVAEIEADVTTVDEKIEREAKEAAEEASTFNLTTSKAIEPTTLEKGKGKVLSIVRTLKNKLGAAVSKNVNTVPVVEEVIQSSAKSIDIDIKGQMGGKGGLKLRKFVINNKADIINNASSTWLMGKNKKGSSVVNGGIPIVIEKSVGGRYTGKTIEINVGGKTVTVEEFIPNFLPYPEWAGKKIDREKTIKRGQTSGNQIVRKVDPLEVDDKAFADFVTTEDGTPIRGRKESLANELAGRLGGQIFKEAIADPDSDISKAFEQNQDLRGAVLSDNFRNEVIEQTERGLIARSAGVDALTQEMNTIIKDVFDRKSYKSMGEALGRLETIKGEFKELKLTPEIKESIDTISRIIQDIVWGEKNRGVQAEIEMVDAIKKAAKVIPGLYINPNFNPAGTKGGVPDIVFYVDGKKITLENKLTIYSQIKALPALSITKDGIAPIKTSDTELDAKLNNAVKNHKPLQKLVKLLAEDGRGEYSTLRTGRKTIRIKKSDGVGGQQQGFYWQAENLVKNEFGENNFELKVKGTIKDLNTILGKNNFQTNEIHFMDVGLVQLSEFSKLNTPNKLNLDDTVDIRFVVYRNASTDSNDNIKHYNLTIKPTFLLSEASRTKVSASETVNFVNPGDISKATKNTYNNNATQAASKGKAEVETLNKQYKNEQDALIAQSKGKLSPEFNRIIERTSGIGARKKLSGVAARRMGKNKGVFKLFLPPGAEDLKGLYYTMLGKGRQGDADKKFFEDNLVKPYARGIQAMEKAKQALLNDYKALRKAFKQGFKQEGIKIKQDIPGAKITVEQAIRIYLWSDADFEIPGLTAADQKKALEYVYKNPAVQAYADSLLAISKQEQWSKPNEYWDAQSILSDLTDIALNVNRKQYLEQFIANKNELFSADNLNKLEAAFGQDFRESIEDIMYRMETGSNRPTGRNTIAKKWNNWLNNSVGAIMFFNRRSATLQLLSTANFMNTSDNNPIKAAAAFANQKQYWKDWAMIFNSAKLKERRGGLKNEVQASEIAEAARGAKNKPLAIISYLLKIGFLPTQIADSVAIASGGSAFYRNRVNTYKKQGFEQAEAETKAFEDFGLISDETQQSGDPMLVSRQQADPIGRPILAFQNTPMQITRFQKRNVQDLINRRRIEGKTQFQSDATYLTRIAYYTAVQNLIFSSLQQGLFTLIPGFDDEEDEEIEKTTEKKVFDTVNSMLDTTLRGSGIYGAIGSTIKNVIIEYMRQQEKDPFAKDNAKILLQALNVSPPLGSKARKFYGAFQTMDYEKDVIAARGFGMMIDGKFQLSPKYQVMGSLASAVANVPLDRVVSEVDGITEALDTRNTEYQRLMLLAGWKTWQIGAEIEEHKAIKTTAKATRKAEGIEKRKQKSAEKRKIEINAYQSMSNEEINTYIDWKTKNKGKRLYDYLEETNKL